jgi:exonuclease VII small subunit
MPELFTQEFELAKSQWESANKQLENSIKLYKDSQNLLKDSLKELNTAWDNFQRQIKIMDSKNVINFPKKED